MDFSKGIIRNLPLILEKLKKSSLPKAYCDISKKASYILDVYSEKLNVDTIDILKDIVASRGPFKKKISLIHRLPMNMFSRFTAYSYFLFLANRT
ncbi:hypothetical protein FACS1894184_06070 [Clostridia bacterium]|nr:hypothetical protein FACS1894184_06070 [Clostridia bacterium]